MSGLAYLDASAVVKLLIHEPETPALHADIVHRPGLLASTLSILEARRAVARRTSAQRIASLEEIIDALVLVEMGQQLVAGASTVPPPSLRSLDAIHVATALSLGDPAVDVITYDHRLADAARANGLTVVQPGRESQT